VEGNLYITSTFIRGNQKVTPCRRSVYRGQAHTKISRGVRPPIRPNYTARPPGELRTPENKLEMYAFVVYDVCISICNGLEVQYGSASKIEA
jgi:hypothetical protein